MLNLRSTYWVDIGSIFLVICCRGLMEFLTRISTGRKIQNKKEPQKQKKNSPPFDPQMCFTLRGLEHAAAVRRRAPPPTSCAAVSRKWCSPHLLQTSFTSASYGAAVSTTVAGSTAAGITAPGVNAVQNSCCPGVVGALDTLEKAYPSRATSAPECCHGERRLCAWAGDDGTVPSKEIA